MATAVIGLKNLVPRADSVPAWNIAMTAALLTMLPPVMVVIVLQRWFVQRPGRQRQVTATLRNDAMAMIVGHRGARNLWPENSLSGFRAARRRSASTPSSSTSSRRATAASS